MEILIKLRKLLLLCFLASSVLVAKEDEKAIPVLNLCFYLTKLLYYTFKNRVSY